MRAGRNLNATKSDRSPRPASPNLAPTPRLLEEMRAVKALDVGGDGRIDEQEFLRLNDPLVVLKAKVDTMWAALEKEEDGAVERLRCWDYILADDELCRLIQGGTDAAKGKRILEAMKFVKALDVGGDGRIDEQEFQRLYLPEVIAAAELRAYVDNMWQRMEKDDDGTIDRLDCWDLILADMELVSLQGATCGVSKLEKGKAVLEAMKKKKALDVDGDGRIAEDEFKRLYDIDVIADAKKLAGV